MNYVKLNKVLSEALDEQDTNSLIDIFGYLNFYEAPSNLQSADNNKVTVDNQQGRLIVTNDSKDIEDELTIEQCKDKDTLLKVLKDKGLFHPETIDLELYGGVDPEDTVIFISGFVDPENPKINIVYTPAGRGHISVIRDVGDDEILNSLSKAGFLVKDYETVKETSMGILLSVKLGGPFGGQTKAFLYKDGKLRSADISTLLKIIKEG